MTHFHSHTACKHENLKYCAVCGEVYCNDCGKEWVMKNQYYIYPYYTSTNMREPVTGTITSTPVERHEHP